MFPLMSAFVVTEVKDWACAVLHTSESIRWSGRGGGGEGGEGGGVRAPAPCKQRLSDANDFLMKACSGFFDLPPAGCTV